MSGGRLTISIDGREALPIRAIPYVTGWQRFTPDVVAWYLAQDDERYTKSDMPLTAYHFDSGIASAVTPREWDAVVLRLKGFEAETRLLPDDQGNALWRAQASCQLPPGVFVWLDEFLPVYQARCRLIALEGERPGDNQLILAPGTVEAATRTMVMEGFTESQTDTGGSQMGGLLPGRINAIVEMARQLNFPPMAVPFGGKATIERECLEKMSGKPHKFTADIFKTVWQAARDKGVIDVVDAKTYRGQ